MAALSKDQVASYLRQAGFPEEKIPLFVNIAALESGLNPGAHNPNAATGDDSYGLFQINMLGAMGPERRRQFKLNSNKDLFDPLTNARAALEVYKSQGVNAWTTAKRAMETPAPKLTPGLSTPTPGLGESSSGLDPIESMMSAILGDTLSSVSRRSPEPGRKAFSQEFQSEWSKVGDPLSRGVEAQVAAIEALLPGQTAQPRVSAVPASAAPMPAGDALTGNFQYIEGGIGPNGSGTYGPHFDIKRVDQGYYDRTALDPYVRVNGKPLSAGTTVAGGEFGASRDGGSRKHAGWDYAFGGGGALSLTGGAQWLSSSPGDYGDAAVFRVPGVGDFRILHGKLKQA